MNPRKTNVSITIVLTVLALLTWLHGWWIAARPGVPWMSGLPSHVTYLVVLATAFSACAVVGWVLVTQAAARGDGETRCRKCGHILRGLSEPRCPECGTPI